MEPLLAQLKSLPDRVMAMQQRSRVALVVAAVALVGVAATIGLVTARDARYEYVFTRLGTEDLSAATAVLTGAGIPFKVEAAGEALAVESGRVHEARLLLAAQGLPRAAGVGFELFDKSDLGVSAFTQKVNLQRAVEGELVRTITSLEEVRAARVHVTMSRKGLFREEGEESRASVVVHLFPGRTLGERQVRGVRHLVAAAVPGLVPESVTVVDGKGVVLTTGDANSADIEALAKRTEAELEARVVAVLEPAVGAGAVVAKVTAELDQAKVETEEQLYDADNPALRSERARSDVKGGVAGAEGVVGAAGNEPPSGGAKVTPPGQLLSSEEAKNYEVSSTRTRKIVSAPRVRRLSVAVVVDEGDTPLPPETLSQLSALAKGAIGFDTDRGDQIVIQSSKFRTGPRTFDGEAFADETPAAVVPTYAYVLGGLLALMVVAAGVVAVRARRRGADEMKALAVLSGGGRVSDLEAAIEIPGPAPLPAPPETNESTETERALVERARTLSRTEPVRAALLIRAWLDADHVEGREGEAHA